MAMNKTTMDKIAAQALDEIARARTFKQGKIANWQKNEELYYSKKIKTTEARANVSLGRMQEFVHTLLSKIDNPLLFKFVKRKNSQLKRAEFLNSMRKSDSEKDNWDIKDIVGKKQAIIYGRAIYSYYADSHKGYKAHLEPIDVYDFLIDPACGGIDIEEARFMGSYSVILDKKKLKDGKKNGTYIKSAVDDLLEGSGNAGEGTQEETNKTVRDMAQNTIGRKETSDENKFKFWRWFTTYQEDGERYYLLMNNQGQYIRCEKLTEIFDPTPEFEEGMWPFWTWASFPDLTEFWTPSYCDYAREIFMAQNVSVNQMLDNAEAINKPMKVVNVGAIENLAALKYRRDGIIPTKGEYDVNRAVQVIQTPSIRTPIEVFNLLEAIQEKASGVTAGAAGVADEDGKVGIYEGNQAATADRLGLLNKSYAFGYKRFAKLYELGIRQHLTKKVAIDVVGPQGAEVHEVSRRDIFKKNEDFAVMIEASNAQLLSSIQDKTAKINFLSAQAINPIVNQKKSFEIQAETVGFSEDEIEQLLDKSFYGNSELMSECDRDIEALIEGEALKPNMAANNAYRQRMLDYMTDHEEDLKPEQFTALSDYFVLLEPFVMRNEARALQQEQMNAMAQAPASGQARPITGSEVVPSEAQIDLTQPM